MNKEIYKTDSLKIRLRIRSIILKIINLIDNDLFNTEMKILITTFNFFSIAFKKIEL